MNTLNPHADNRIVVDLNKVQYARFRYRTRCGRYSIDLLPTEPTYLGKTISPEDIAYGTNNTMLQVAKERGLCDVWIPFLTLTITANKHITYTGKKACSIWKEWCKRQFKNK